jgi:AAA family ATP:ADP antiporter
MTAPLGRILRRGVDVRPGESGALLWSCAFFFCVLSAYYVIRPVRDDMGVAGGVENLAWLFTATLVGMLVVHPVFTALVARLPRRRFVPLIYRLFILTLVAFWLLLRIAEAAEAVWIGRIFFVWTSVFNLFVVSVFWSFMADLYRPAQAERLFGMIAVGGTLGAILGSTITSGLVSLVGPANLLLASALLLELAARAANALERHEESLAREGRSDEAAASRVVRPIGGGVFEGIRAVARSPYLLGIATLMLLFTITSTFLYFQQADIVARTFRGDPQGRTRLFAGIDLAVNVLTLGTQIFLTGRVLRWLGVGAALAFLPLLSLVGFGLLGVAPVLAVLVGFQVLRRAGNFAIQRPAREVLYTVLSRTDKYKAKNFNDTFVYRVGDQAGAWSYTVIAWLGLGLSGLAFTMVPLSAAWFFLALWLGRRRTQIHEEAKAMSDATKGSPRGVVSRRDVLGMAGAVVAGVMTAGWPVTARAAPPTPMKIGIIGAGRIGGTLGELWVKAGHQVLLSSRHPENLKELAARLGLRARAGTPREAAAFGEVILVAVPYGALPQVGRDFAAEMRGKVVLDAANPFPGRDGPVAEEARRRGTGVASAHHLPGVRLVRAFNTIPSTVLRDEAHRAGERIAVPLAADDREALAVASRLVEAAGFEPVVVGPLGRARDFDPGTPVFGRGLTARELRQRLGSGTTRP